MYIKCTGLKRLYFKQATQAYNIFRGSHVSVTFPKVLDLKHFKVQLSFLVFLVHFD